MRRFYRVVVAAVAIVGTAALAAAQTPSGVLNKLEVQKLVAAETPEASVALAAHFDALADRYLADAANHKAMGQAYKANANRSAVTSAADHCDRLAKLANDSAAAARELAKYHRDLSGGKAAVLPKGAAALQGGKGAPDPTGEQLHHLAMMARTRADHLSLQEYFATLAKKNTAEAEDYTTMAKAYRAGAHKGTYDAAVTFDRLARIARDAAKEADGVRMPRVAENGSNRPLLDEPSRVEDADASAHLRDDSEVVADEEDCGVELSLQLRDEVEHLGLDRRVETRGRLVEDEECRVLRQRHRDHDALLHSARELVRVTGHDGPRIGDLHVRECLPRALVRLARRHTEHRERLGDLPPDAERRVQGGAGVLVDHRHRLAAEPP